MTKLKSIIRYECVTSFKYIWVFYAIQYTIVFLTLSIVAVNVFGGLELNSMVYVGVLGVLGFKEDFKMLIQHGFTRKYIFVATLALFAFISALLALVDTVMGYLFYYNVHGYHALYGNNYGYENGFLNFLWLFMLYMLTCSVAYFVVLTINNMGKIKSLFMGVALTCVIALVSGLYIKVVSEEMKSAIGGLVLLLMGLPMNGGTQPLVPILTMFCFWLGVSACSYVVLRRTELC